MKRIRQACRIFAKDSDPNRAAGVSRESLYGDINDEWGISPHHFQIIPPSREKPTKGLRQMRSMPFPSREGWVTTDDVPPAVPTTRPPPAARHTGKNSKAAQILGIAGAPAKTKEDVHVVDPLSNIMSPPILPVEADPFAGGPPGAGATIVGNGLPAVQPHVKHPPAPQQQRVFRPMLSMPSLSVATERHGTHADLSHSTGGSNIESAARRVPRPLHENHMEVGSLSTRSRSNQPSSLSVPSHYASSSQPSHPSRVVNVERKKSRHDLVYSHVTHWGGTPAAPNLRKARSSVVLSNTSLIPLHAPKPLRVSEKPSAEALHLLVESPSAKPSHSRVQNGVSTTHTVWPPAPVVRPLRIVMPPRAEREVYQAAAVEAEKVSRKIRDERALLERVRHEPDREARVQARDSRRHRERHHRRAETEGSRRCRREAENHSMAGYEYPTVPVRVGAAW